MAFDPDAYLAKRKERFNPDEYLAKPDIVGDAKLFPEHPGVGESILGGALNGATFGFADELTGALAATGGAVDSGNAIRNIAEQIGRGENPIDKYRAVRDWVRERKRAEHEGHPLAYGAGTIAGGLATVPLIPAAAGWAGAAKTGAAIGATQGLGESESDLTKGDISGAVKDTGIGAGIGAAFGVGAKAVGETAKAVSPFLKKMGAKILSAIFGPSSEAIEARMANPEAIKNALTNDDIARKLAAAVNKIKAQGIQLSEEAIDKLTDDPDIQRSVLSGTVDDIGGSILSKEIGNVSETENLALSKIGKIKDRIEKIPGPGDYAEVLESGTEPPPGLSPKESPPRIGSFGEPLSVNPPALSDPQIFESAGSPLPPNGGLVSEKALGKTVRSIDKDINWDDQFAEFLNEKLESIRNELDSILKRKNPGYEEAMKPVAERMRAVENARRLFGLRDEPGKGLVPRDVTQSKFGPILRDKNSVSRETLERVGELAGENFVEDAKNRMFADQFKGGATQGSRRVNLGGAVGAGTGYLSGFVTGHPGIGATVGGAVGSATGALIDKEGGKIAGDIVDFFVKTKPEVFGKYAPALMKASARGGSALAIENFLLQQHDPEYRATLKAIQNGAE